ncbi:MAG: antibiotic biosynthesis monooxygenase [Gammaproteobacteria bacterium]|nr:antibiotic biosynthesis monooxygenase [Gammaproteobacteria bacterium]
MLVVIFRATIRDLDDEYRRTAQRLRELALGRYGCRGFHSVTEGRQEVSLSYWPSAASIRAWKADSEHAAAQRLGRERWYESYTVEVAEITRGYRMQPPAAGPAASG